MLTTKFFEIQTKVFYNNCEKDECINAYLNIFPFATSLTHDVNHKLLSGIVVMVYGLNKSCEKCYFDQTFHTHIKMKTKYTLHIRSLCIHLWMLYICQHITLRHGWQFTCKYIYQQEMTECEASRLYKNDATNITESLANETSNTINGLNRKAPNIWLMLFPILDSVQSTLSGFWTTLFYVNGITLKLHTKQICAYTLTTVPTQKCMSQSYTKKTLLTYGIFCVYNWQLTRHQQSCVQNYDTGADMCFNISSSGNKKLINHLQKKNYSMNK